MLFFGFFWAYFHFLIKGGLVLEFEFPSFPVSQVSFTTGLINTIILVLSGLSLSAALAKILKIDNRLGVHKNLYIKELKKYNRK